MQSNDRSGAAHGESRINEDSIRRHLIEQIARRTRTPDSEVDPDRPLEEFGLASRDALAMAGELEQLLGRSLPATLVWEFPTINRLSAALATGADLAAAAPATAAAAPERRGPGTDDEPIAVVGVGCRFPGGVTGPESYWRFLLDGGDAIGEVPSGRWDVFDDGSPEVGDLLAETTRLGGFLDDVAQFDAQFFGITPREAAVMDPQQRLVLEVAWEAFEHAGLAPAGLRGSRTGVFVGVSAPEYAAFTASDFVRLEPFTATGAALSIIANRLSYLLDLRGPSMIVDTACSSSLVSTHLAVQSLRAGESDVALAGGVNLLLSPTITMTFDQAGGTASDGRCKAFDASADGMVRAEGCGAVVLKRLSDAERDGDRVFAVIRGSGVNSDGRSNGLVAPNSDAQKALLRDVYADAGIDTREVDYIEAHGTGTLLGDPIEAKAMGEVLGAGRPADQPLLIGSAKSNLGHMESAAGIAGLIKTVLALHHATIPPSLHYTAPNPHIPFDDLRLRVTATETGWPNRDRPARAGVSGFGFGGTNAHVILEQAPPEPVHPEPQIVRPYLLSDVSADRIRDHAGALAGWLSTRPDVPLSGIAHTLHRRNGRGRARAAVAARDRAGLLDGLTALANGEPHPAVVTGSAQGVPGRPVWIFSGYGAQRLGMAQRLLEEEPAFAEAIDDLDGLFVEEAGFSLWDLLENGGEAATPAQTMTALFGVQIGLARLWAAYGITPAAVIGHSMGEVAAAVVAGKLTLADGVKVICRRSKLMMSLVGGGAMAVLGASADELSRLASEPTALTDVHPAVFSSPRQTVVTGAADQVAEIVARAEAEGRLARMVQAEGAGHSPQVEPLLPELRSVLAEVGLEPGTPLAEGITLYTSALDDPRAVTGDVPMDVEHWAANLRNPVRLTDAVAAAAADGHRTFVEVNAHPILVHAVAETLEAEGVGGALVTHTLKRAAKGQPTDDTLTFHAQLATLAVHGLRTAEPEGPLVDLPVVPWRHERHWVDHEARQAAGRDEHPLLGAHVEMPGEDRHAWRADVGTATGLWAGSPPAGARPHGLTLLPAAALAEMALAAGAEALGIDAVRVNGLWLEHPLAVAEHTTVTTTYAEREQRVEIHALTPAGGWVRLASADVGADHRPSPAPLTGVPTEIAAAERGSRHYRLHPEVFDRCLSALAVAAGEGVWLPESIGGLRVHGSAHRGGHCRVEVVHGDEDTVGSIQLSGPDGELIAEASGIVLRRVQRADLPVPLADKLVEVTWDETEPPAPAIESGAWLVLSADDDPFADEVDAGLRDRGHRVIRHAVTRRPPDEHPPMDDAPDGVVLIPSDDLVDEELVLMVAGVSQSIPDASRLWVATRGALPVPVTGAAAESGASAAGRPEHGFVRALTRVLSFERSAIRGTLVDVETAADLVTELVGDAADREVAWRGGVRRTARLAQPRLPDRVPSRMRCHGGSYIITGGYGGIGLVTARLLAARGAQRIVLSGRSGPAPDAEKEIARLRESGVDVGVVLGDIAADGVAERLIEVAREGGARLRGIVHGAAGMDDRLIADLGADDLHRVWVPKVVGARRLHEALAATGADDELDFFVMHSSAAALLGSPGQAAYAAANAAIDALVAWRRAHGRPAATVNWGTWSQVGGAADLNVSVLDPITPEEGAEALEALIAHDRAATGVLRFDPVTAVELFPEIRELPFFAELVAAAGSVSGAAGGDWPGAAALREVDPATARQMISDQVRCRIAAVLGFDPARLDPAAALTDLGLDSLVAVRIKSAVEHDLGLTVPPAILLQGASVNSFEEWAAQELGLSDAPAPTAAPTEGHGAVSNAEEGYVMPRDAAERLVVRVFEKVLGVDRVSVTADFFGELGGQEHQADQVAAALAAEMGLNGTAQQAGINRLELFATPTAEHAAEIVRAADEEAARQTVRLLKAGSPDRTPIFIAHPAGGTTVCYQQLAALLGPDQPVYGLERFEDAPSVEERSARYVEHLLAAQPEGAFRLGGWSFGGVLAYETARRLTAAGREVEFVALFDAGLPLAVDDESETLARRFAAFTDYLNETYGLDIALGYEELSGLDEEAQFALVMERAAPLIEFLPPAVLNHQLTSHQDTRSLEAYKAEPYDGRVILYYAPEETPWSVKDARYVLDGTNGFGELCSNLEIVTIPGVHHLNLLDPPGVQVLAVHLADRLAERDARAAGRTEAAGAQN